MSFALPPRTSFAAALTFVCLSLASAHPSRARACRVELFGVADAAWREAAQELTLSAEDCATVHLEVEGDHALVTLIRHDGRRVARALAAATELSEAVEALKRADPDEAEPLVTSPVAPAPVAPVFAPAPPARPTTSVMFGLLLGVRVGVFGLVSPLIDTSLRLRMRSWEIAVSTDWEVAYYAGWGTSPGPCCRGVAPGLGFARRQRLAHGELLVGGRVGMAVMRPERRGMPGFFSLSDSALANPFPSYSRALEYQGRLAAFLGYALPIHHLVRLRMELGADGVWLSSHAAGPRLGPSLALSTRIGIELGAP